MKVKDADILIVPGYTNSGSDHWQSRWQAKLSTARRVEQAEFRKPVAGAFLVAPPDVANPAIRPKHLMTFVPYPREPLPFPSMTISSRNDPYCAFHVAEDIAAAWGSFFIDAGDAGHINADSGYGPWPEGSMAFAKFLSRL